MRYVANLNALTALECAQMHLTVVLFWWLRSRGVLGTFDNHTQTVTCVSPNQTQTGAVAVEVAHPPDTNTHAPLARLPEHWNFSRGVSAELRGAVGWQVALNGQQYTSNAVQVSSIY